MALLFLQQQARGEGKAKVMEVTDTVTHTQVPIALSSLKAVTPITSVYQKLFMNKHDIVNIVEPSVNKIERKLPKVPRLRRTVLFKLPKRIADGFASSDIRQLDRTLRELQGWGLSSVTNMASDFKDNVVALAPVSLSKQLENIRIWSQEELKNFTAWHMAFSAKVMAELQDRETIWRTNDEKNRQESEKLYQLQVIENTRVRSQIIRMANLHLKMLELMISIMNQLKNSIFISMSIKMATLNRHKILNRRMTRFLRREDRLFRKELVDIEREMVADYLENETYNV